LELYFRSIDPTSLNRQGNDYGTRYRTGIYYTSKEDISTIHDVYQGIERIIGEQLLVEVEPLRNCHPAEEYHQDYLDKNPRGYCHIPFELMIMAREANKE
jgi:peptide methionine sulfoxide reductase msrA/msrB